MKPWINLEQIGKEKEIIQIDEIKLEIFKDDLGGTTNKEVTKKTVYREFGLLFTLS